LSQQLDAASFLRQLGKGLATGNAPSAEALFLLSVDYGVLLKLLSPKHTGILTPDLPEAFETGRTRQSDTYRLFKLAEAYA
jgi:hypothetical protein